ncbi:hypothetical protein CBM2629_A150123 [Cupriavidus taiwanensis]|nr:hypothetical protein CBM2629_A150123 [Cupriavidus taiwanensis]
MFFVAWPAIVLVHGYPDNSEVWHRVGSTLNGAACEPRPPAACATFRKFHNVEKDFGPQKSRFA